MEWYEALREEFPILKKMVYIDIAHTNSPATRVINAIREFQTRAQTEGTEKDRWTALVESTRGKIAKLIGSETNEVSFVKNTSEAICIAAEGIHFSSGDNVIINDLEHTPEPWLYLRRKGVDVRVAKSENGRLDPKNVFGLVDSKTRAIFMSHVTYHTGFRNDLATYGKFCRERNIIYVVDAIQSLGAVRCDVHKLGVSILACGGHKWLFGPHGTGFLFCSRDVLPQISATHVAYNSPAVKLLKDSSGAPSSLSIDESDARKFEFGQPNYEGLSGLEKGLDIILECGLDKIEKRVLDLTGRLQDGLRQTGATVLTSRKDSERAGIVIVSEPDPKGLIAYLDAAKVKASPRAYGARLSPDFYNSTEEIDKAIELVRSFVESRVAKVPKKA